ncbi:MAG TPA: YceH family protein [Bryobacteraceae bacterium]|jgi:hypothetical protein
MLPLLDSEEVRVLGALIEKETTTPEYYPMSLNALVNACNQKSNRHPVVNYDEEIVLQAVDRLRDKKMAAVIVGGGRVNKYAQRFSELLNLGRRETALMCTLLLRGPQTLGELSGRSERMHAFEDLDEVDRTLDRMASHEAGKLVTKLARVPGQKESRYAQLLSGEPPEEELAAVSAPASSTPVAADRISALENEVAALRSEVEELRRQLEAFQRQFS